MKKIKLKLNKESITTLDEMSQTLGGIDTDTITATVEHLASVLTGTACAFATIIMVSRAHCPTAQTDCDTCTCHSRWCQS